jgi:thioredoxin reductase (NADPH)
VALFRRKKFGAQMMVGQRVVKFECDQRPYRLSLENGDIVQARSIIIAAGAQYNTPNVANLKKFEGNGIYYAATFMESQLCGGDEVVVIGGGNRPARQPFSWRKLPKRSICWFAEKRFRRRCHAI